MPFESPTFKKLVEDTLGLNDFGIGKLRDVNWGKRWYWAVRFVDPKPPSPFNTFFPATDITLPESNLNSLNFEQGQGSFRVPQRSDLREVSLTFYDDENHTLLDWLNEWIQVDILNGGQFVSCLKDDHMQVSGSGKRVHVCRVLELTKLNNSLEPLPDSTTFYTVYPEGQIEFIGGSGSEANIYTVTFNIVGQTFGHKSEAQSDQIKDSVKKGAQLLGRFI